MAQLKTKQKENPYNQGYPTVFKKIDQADVKVNPFQVFKTFEILSGSLTSSALPLKAVYIDTDNLPALGSELVYNDAANMSKM